MPVARARFVAAARREFLAQVDYYEAKERGLGLRFTAAVEDSVARALAFPFAGSTATARTRRVFVARFPFAVVYRPDADGIVVFALAHQSQRPEYWDTRVSTQR